MYACKRHFGKSSRLGCCSSTMIVREQSLSTPNCNGCRHAHLCQMTAKLAAYPSQNCDRQRHSTQQHDVGIIASPGLQVMPFVRRLGHVSEQLTVLVSYLTRKAAAIAGGARHYPRRAKPWRCLQASPLSMAGAWATDPPTPTLDHAPKWRTGENSGTEFDVCSAVVYSY